MRHSLGSPLPYSLEHIVWRSPGHYRCVAYPAAREESELRRGIGIAAMLDLARAPLPSQAYPHIERPCDFDLKAALTRDGQQIALVGIASCCSHGGEQSLSIRYAAKARAESAAQLA